MGRKFEELFIWRLAYDIVLDVYKVIEKLPESESKNLVDQMRRAATSMPVNIAEGCSFSSNKQFLSHLNYAYSSAKELEVLLMLCTDLHYVDKNDIQLLKKKLSRFRGKTYLFMASVEREITIGKKNFGFYKKGPRNSERV